MGFVFKFFVQDCYFQLFGEHFFTTTARINPALAKRFVQLNYGQRPWRDYPIAEGVDGQEVIFIHVPKCGGTSVANALGWEQVRHLSAAVFAMTDPARFEKADVFALIRNPLERLASSLMHLERSPFRTPREERLYRELGINEANLHEHVRGLLTDSSYQRIYIGTHSGRSGFSVLQSDFLTHHGALLVPNVFTLERIDLLEGWLSSRLGRAITFPRSNSSDRTVPLLADEELEKLAREQLAPEYQIYDYVAKHGAVCEGGQELAGLQAIVSEGYRASKS